MGEPAELRAQTLAAVCWKEPAACQGLCFTSLGSGRQSWNTSGKSSLGASASSPQLPLQILLTAPAHQALPVNRLAVLAVYYHCSFPKTEAAHPGLACPHVPVACDIFSITGTD